MMAGRVTPRVVVDFETRCSHYFQMAKEKISEEQKVNHILGSFEDHRVADWASTQTAVLTAMKFTDFMKTFRERWLPRNWEQSVLLRIQKSPLNPDKETFEEWATRLQSLNATLQGTDSLLNDTKMRAQLETLMDEDLQLLVKRANLPELKALHEWLRAVQELDEERQKINRHQDKHIADLIENSIRK